MIERDQTADYPSRGWRIGLAVAAVVCALGCASLVVWAFWPDRRSCYQRLVEARNERERIELVKWAGHGRGTEECLAGLAQYWMDHTDYVEDHPTLRTLLAAAIYEGRYHSPDFQHWVTEVLGRSTDGDRRSSAWVFASVTEWTFDEARLLEAVQHERNVKATGEYTDIEMIHDSIARIGRRLYPNSAWWKTLIQERYGK